MARSVEEFRVALHICEDAEDDPRYGKVCNDFLANLYALSELSFTHTESLGIINEALDYGSRSLAALKKGDNGYELARCYYLLSVFLPDRSMDVIESTEKQQELLKVGTGYVKTAVELSEKEGAPGRQIFGLNMPYIAFYKIEDLG